MQCTSSDGRGNGKTMPSFLHLLVLEAGKEESEEVMMRSLGNQITGNSTLLITCRDTSYIR